MARWKIRTDFERFTEKVTFGFGDDACWTWLGAYQKDGYGSMGIIIEGKWKQVLVHRFSYSYFIDVVPDDMEVCHHCDNRACVNPKHLFLGTQRDNVLDMEKKGRSYNKKGENNPKSKLVEDDIRTIRNWYATGLYSQKELSRLFSVSQTHIGYIVRNKTWSHIV